ncbi:hypothetical protein A2972_02840 [Candidatus Amesbacteria bacterium RIFCSPLOWO2_01_FULL_47_33]|uniref:Uncharacterized protein n=1 Tax=Candidatus Amesbacteria bacterium RIFCSPLOWO2_01_FULL_47_33 TaxID=1797258 RepID=A0A1F4Z1U4_9BACT|nr:MAG: hypothetical protein A2972_02840 [Candidatus Amesbacteria bacterium RIFCSPLOWO2_01_FULL_47_33]
MAVRRIFTPVTPTAVIVTPHTHIGTPVLGTLGATAIPSVQKHVSSAGHEGFRHSPSIQEKPAGHDCPLLQSVPHIRFVFGFTVGVGVETKPPIPFTGVGVRVGILAETGVVVGVTLGVAVGVIFPAVGLGLRVGDGPCPTQQSPEYHTIYPRSLQELSQLPSCRLQVLSNMEICTVRPHPGFPVSWTLDHVDSDSRHCSHFPAQVHLTTPLFVPAHLPVAGLHPGSQV